MLEGHDDGDDDDDGDEEYPYLYWSRLKGGKIVASLLTDLVNIIQEETKSTKTEFKILIRKRRSPLCNVGQSDSLAKTKTKRQRRKKQRQRRSPLYNVGPSDNLDRSWVEAGTPSPSASRTASRISPEILSFMRGARIFGKNMAFCTNQGWGPVFRNRNFW